MDAAGSIPSCAASTQASASSLTPLFRPAELGAEGLGDRGDGVRVAKLRGREQAEPGAAQQHVGDRARLLGAGGDHDLRQQVGAARP